MATTTRARPKRSAAKKPPPPQKTSFDSDSDSSSGILDPAASSKSSSLKRSDSIPSKAPVKRSPHPSHPSFNDDFTQDTSSPPSSPPAPHPRSLPTLDVSIIDVRKSNPNKMGEDKPIKKKKKKREQVGKNIFQPLEIVKTKRMKQARIDGWN
ncbi:hypothetical protein TrVE_jg12868 [Triparma verrucosa]|uniref:Uncharacterized protein n=1 Tax=Triparma verrucosa TaxID=1606542 RepID=A0A9W7F929_9STRA|nr:hypothetical protein TrVE_jg12868 [Triparma verrucosa]